MTPGWGWHRNRRARNALAAYRPTSREDAAIVAWFDDICDDIAEMLRDRTKRADGVESWWCLETYPPRVVLCPFRNPRRVYVDPPLDEPSPEIPLAGEAHPRRFIFAPSADAVRALWPGMDIDDAGYVSRHVLQTRATWHAEYDS